MKPNWESKRLPFVLTQGTSWERAIMLVMTGKALHLAPSSCVCLIAVCVASW
jgi:hypothetical protein